MHIFIIYYIMAGSISLSFTVAKLLMLRWPWRMKNNKIESSLSLSAYTIFFRFVSHSSWHFFFILFSTSNNFLLTFTREYIFFYYHIFHFFFCLLEVVAKNHTAKIMVLRLGQECHVRSTIVTDKWELKAFFKSGEMYGDGSKVANLNEMEKNLITKPFFKKRP